MIEMRAKQIIRRLISHLPWRLLGPLVRISTLSVFQTRQFRKLRVGKNSYVDPSVQIIGWRNVLIGSNTAISEESWINVNYREKEKDRVIIGNNCHIGRRNFFSSGPLIKIGDYGFTGIDCRFLGCGHILILLFSLMWHLG